MILIVIISGDDDHSNFVLTIKVMVMVTCMVVGVSDGDIVSDGDVYGSW